MNILDLLLWMWVAVAAASLVATILLGRLMAPDAPAAEHLHDAAQPEPLIRVRTTRAKPQGGIAASLLASRRPASTHAWNMSRVHVATE